MSLNDTVSAERVHITLFGLRNAGKSSLINALTGQPLAVVSPIKGTTTDPVKKAMELLPLGPVLLTDTPGLDDSGDLGAQRVEKAKGALSHTDIALHVVDAAQGLTASDEAMLAQYRDRGLPYLLVMNKADLPGAEETAAFLAMNAWVARRAFRSSRGSIVTGLSG